MNRIDNSGQGLARLGRDEDKYMAHVAPNEMVVPPVISPETRALIEAEMKAVGLDPNEYTVGEGMSINPITGMPEFGWLKKTFKSVKKVVKKAAPIVGVASMFIPGLGPAISGALGGLGSSVVTGLSKIPGIGGALSSGASALGRGIGALTGMGGGAAGATGGATSGNLFSRIKSGIGSYFNPAEGATGIFGGGIGPSLRRGIGGLFGGGMGNMPGMPGNMPEMEFDASGNPTGLYIDPVTKETFTFDQLKEAGLIDNSGNVVGSALSNLSQGKSGGLGSLFGGTPGQSKIGLIEDFLKGKSSDPVRDGGGLFGGMLGGNMGAAGIAALLGKTVYDAAKERQGGLAATPAVTMDALGRYSLANALGTGGTREEFGLGPAPSSLKFNMGGPVNRQYFNQGGAAIKELDMRDGGESAGPGTGTSDDIPAMLSDGEFVMTAKATRGAGAFGMNKTKSGIELVKGGKASREKGVENMRELMNIFEAI